RELGDEGVGPVRVRVELEAEVGIQAQPRVDALRRRRLTETHRDNERDRLVRAPDRLAERGSRLTEREVERGAPERPPAVVQVDQALGQRVEERLCRGGSEERRGG